MSLASTLLPASPQVAAKANLCDQPDFPGEPAWLAERRQGAWREFETRPMPTRNDERWRFSNLQNLSLDGFHRPATLSGHALGQVRSRSELVPAVAQLTFADDHLLERVPVPADLARRGVIFLPLAEALVKHPELLRQHLFLNDRALGGEKFLGLHQASTRAGAFLYVPEGVDIPGIFVAAHWAATAGAAIFPHTLIIAGANSTIHFLDYYGNASSSDPSLAVGAATIIAGTGSHVFRKSVQNLNAGALAFQTDTVVGDRDSEVKNIAVHLGARRARYESYARLCGPGANLKLYSLTIATGKQEFDQRTFQDHAAPNTTSDLLYKNALLDEAHTIFAGMIRVEPTADGTDAYQQNRNLLLNPAAEATSLPGLEILNQNVRCTHGATTSRLNPEELFYLRSRGLPRHIAHQLLVYGFFEEIIAKVENPDLADLLRRLTHEKFAEQVI